MGSRRCHARSSAKSRARAAGRLTRRAPRTSGRRKRRDRPAARADRSAAAVAVGSPTSSRRSGTSRRNERMSGRIRRQRTPRRRVRMLKRVAVMVVVALAGAVEASAQVADEVSRLQPAVSTPSSTAAQSPTTPDSRSTPTDDVGRRETRPATTTINSATRGCGSCRRARFCPTAEVVGERVSRRTSTASQGFTDVSDWPVTFGDRVRGSGGDFRVLDGRSRGSTATCGRCSSDQPDCGRGGERASVRAAGLVGQPSSGTCWLGAKVST